jgi:hypothetical protein
MLPSLSSFFFGVILISISFVDATSEVFAEDRGFRFEERANHDDTRLLRFQVNAERSMVDADTMRYGSSLSSIKSAKDGRHHLRPFFYSFKEIC